MSQFLEATRSGPRSPRWSARDQGARRSLGGSDEDVMRRIARGDGDALAVLHHRSAELVYANVRRVLRDPALAEQVTEQVFQDLPTLAVRFDPGGDDARMWLLALAHERATARATDYLEPTRSEAASEPSTTSRATRSSLRLLRRA